MYKFTLQPTEITLHDPTVPGETKLNFIEKGLTYTKFPTKVKDIGSALYDQETNSGLDSNQKELYEKELEEILKNNVDNVEEVIVFDHVIRSSKVAGKGTKICTRLTYIPYPDVQYKRETTGESQVMKINVTSKEESLNSKKYLTNKSFW